MIYESIDTNAIVTACPPSDACPASLRTVLDRWKIGQATNAELIEASYCAQLDLLSDYRFAPLPVNSIEARSHARQRNHSNLLTLKELKELLEWDTAKSLPDSALSVIQDAIDSYGEHAPASVEEVFAGTTRR